MNTKVDYSLTKKIFFSVTKLQHVPFSSQLLAQKHETFLKKVPNKNIFQGNLDGSSGQLSNSESFPSVTLHKKWSFPLTISAVNVTESALSYKFGEEIYWRNS